MDDKVVQVYGSRLRVRACGICWKDERLLMVNHDSLTSAGFWAPPGGGIDFGMSAAETLKKEFMEETGLTILPGQFRFGCEFIQKPLHSIELFFEASIISGTLKTGTDPELPIIRDVRFMSPADIAAIPAHELHGIFRLIGSPADLKN